MIVPRANPHSIITISLRRPVIRGVLLAPAVILALVGCWFAIHWYLGDTVAEVAGNSRTGGTDLADLAVKWAPDDPLAHLVLGDLYRKEFTGGSLADSIREYRLAVSLAPNDYRYWMQLGRALEASGDSAAGEKALRHAAELAPAYSYPRWYLANLLLRAGNQDEALRELVRASDADPQLLPQVFNITWEIFGGNVEEIAKVTCPTPEANADLALYLARRNEFDSAARIWASISTRDRKAMHESSEALSKLFLDAGRFHYGSDVIRDLDPDRAAQTEKFANAGFESDVPTRRGDRFGWVINSSIQAEISIDHTEWHGGRSSLKVIFKSPGNLDALNVSQLIVVEPNTQYRFECYARTRDLVTGGTPVFQIRDPMEHPERATPDYPFLRKSDDSVLGESAPLPDGTNEWQLVTIEFKTRPGMDGVLLKLVRASCGQDQFCPIFGTVWYDDFSLQRSSAPAIVRSGDDARARDRNRAFAR